VFEYTSIEAAREIGLLGHYDERRNSAKMCSCFDNEKLVT